MDAEGRKRERRGWGIWDLSRWRQLGRGRWLIRVQGAAGAAGCVRVVCAFPFWGGFADGRGKRRQGDKKNKGRFWRAKSSLFGRESVAAFLVGDLGCARRDQGSADFRLDAAVAPPTRPFRFETGVAHFQGCHFQACRQSVTLVARCSSLAAHRLCRACLGQPRLAAPCGISCSLRPSPARAWCYPDRAGRGPAGKGPSSVASYVPR